MASPSIDNPTSGFVQLPMLLYIIEFYYEISVLILYKRKWSDWNNIISIKKKIADEMLLYYIAILAVHTYWLARVSHFQSVVIVVLLNVLKWPYSFSKDLHQFSLHFLHALYVNLKSLLVVWTFQLFNDEVSPLNQHISHYLTMTNFSYLKIANINELGLQNSWLLLCHYHDDSFLKIVMKYICLVLYLGL
jgi:hypothetical protein